MSRPKPVALSPGSARRTRVPTGADASARAAAETAGGMAGTRRPAVVPAPLYAMPDTTRSFLKLTVRADPCSPAGMSPIGTTHRGHASAASRRHHREGVESPLKHLSDFPGATSVRVLMRHGADRPRNGSHAPGEALGRGGYVQGDRLLRALQISRTTVVR